MFRVEGWDAPPPWQPLVGNIVAPPHSNPYELRAVSTPQDNPY